MRRCLVLFGITCILGQVLVLREFLVLARGDELAVGLALAAWLLTSAAGCGLLGRMAISARLSVPCLVIALAGAGALIPLTVPLVRVLPLVSWMGTLDRLFLAALIASAPLALVMGFLYALCGAVAARTLPEAPAAPAETFVFTSLGMLLGGVLLGGVLLDVFSAVHTALALAALNALTAFVLWWHTDRAAHPWGWALPPLVLIILLSAISPYSVAVDFLSHAPVFGPWVLRAPVSDTPHGRVAVAGDDQGRAFFLNGAQAASSAPDDVLSLLPVLAHPAPRRVLIVGGSEADAAAILQFPWTQVDQVAISPELGELAREYPDPPTGVADSSRLRRPVATPRGHLRATGPVYNVIILMLPTPFHGEAGRLCTRRFFAEARAAMTPDGVLALRLPVNTARPAEPDRTVAAAVARTMARNFGRTVLLNSTDSVILMATPTDRADWPNPALWTARMKAWRLRSTQVTPESVERLADPRRNTQAFAVLMAGPAQPIHREVHSISARASMRTWRERGAGGKVARAVVDRLMRMDMVDVCMTVTLLAGALALVCAFAERPVRVGLPATLAVAGAAAFGLETVLLAVLQMSSGGLFGGLAWLLAAFAGAGAVAAHVARCPRDPRDRLRLMLLMQTALAALAGACAPALLLAAPAGPTAAPWLLGAMSACAGALAGGMAPLAVSLLAGEDASGRERAPALVQALLWAGGGCGALAVSAALLPVLGAVYACLSLSLLALIGLPLLLLSERRM